MKFLTATIILWFTLVGQSIAQLNKSKIELEKGITLIGTIETFIISKHKIDTCETGQDWKAICLIDGKIWFGSDLGLILPKNQLTKLTIKINETEISLDVSGIFNPNFGNVLGKDQFKLKKNEVGYILNAFFSDGAGTYTTQWNIVKGKSLRTKISTDESDFIWQ